MPRDAGRAREFGEHRDATLRIDRRMREQFERERLQRIAGEDRGGFVERDMHGRLAAAQCVVVHRGQVVVHERVGVDEFDRRRRARRAQSSSAPNAVPVAYTSNGRMRLPPSSAA